MALTARFPRAFLTLWLVTFLGYLSFQLLTASLPLYAVSLGADDAAVGLLAGVIALVSLLSRPWVGWWLDRGGAQWGMAAAGGFYALSALGFLSSRSVAALVGLRTFSGLAIALSATTSLVLTVALAPEHRRGEALSLLSVANSIGQGVGPATGIAIAERAGYPGLFATCVLLSAVAGGLALNLRIGGSVHATRPSDRRVIHLGVLAPGVILAALYLSFGVTFGLLAIHASRRGLANPGLAFVTVAGGQILAQTLLRHVSDRVGRRATIAPGLVLVAAGMGIMARAAGLWLLLGGLLFGIGLGTAVPTIYALASDLVPSDERGRAMGTLGVFLEIGIGTGAIGGGVIGQLFGLETTFALAGAVAITAAVAQWWILLPPARPTAADRSQTGDHGRTMREQDQLGDHPNTGM
jgi:MFS family permease